ncbi:enoyl-CoA hydratase-related protein [Actinocorallia sp. B10E7]|uniref:enoyl-CoA hydratase-related protein n=1 Tax=Actinocorallia sp. B10E7 TaxID=3153558 RepID=UPI00325ED706
MTALLQTFAELDTDPGVDAIVLTGNGKAFCAGLDLRELGSNGGNLGFGTPGPDPNSPWPPAARRSPWPLRSCSWPWRWG